MSYSETASIGWSNVNWHETEVTQLEDVHKPVSGGRQAVPVASALKNFAVVPPWQLPHTLVGLPVYLIVIVSLRPKKPMQVPPRFTVLQLICKSEVVAIVPSAGRLSLPAFFRICSDPHHWNAA